MAIDRSLKYPGRFDNPTPQQPEGAFKNRTTDTSADGSYLEKDWLNDWSAYMSSLLGSAGITANGTVDEVGASQYFDAAKASIGENNNLLVNFNFSVETPDDSQPRPDATPRSYVADYQVFYGWFADSGVGATLTYDGGLVDVTAGTVYQDVTYDGGLQAVAGVIASIAAADLKPKTANVTLTDTGTAWRVSIESGASGTLSAKLEVGDKVTGHVVLDYESAVNALGDTKDDWLDVTAGRAFGVPEVNNTGKSLKFMCNDTGAGAGISLQIKINGILISQVGGGLSPANIRRGTGEITVPNGATYEVLSIGASALEHWSEFGVNISV